MGPVAATVIGIVGSAIVNRWIKNRDEAREQAKEQRTARQATQGARDLPEPPVFAPPMIQGFTRVAGDAREFDEDTALMVLDLLGSRSLEPVTHPDLARFGRAWHVVPLRYGLPVARDVVSAALLDQRAGKNVAVFGSLSLSLLPIASDLPMFLVVGPPSSAPWIAARGTAQNPAGGHFALLSPPALVTPASSPEVLPEEAKTEVVAAPVPATAKTNGAHAGPVSADVIAVAAELVSGSAE